jgi:hypothetical protein
MACPYYRERLGGKVVGYCKDSRESIPSQKHQDCLCKSGTGIYTEFCPIYAKLRRDEQKQGFLSRFINGSRPKSPQSLEEVKR